MRAATHTNSVTFLTQHPPPPPLFWTNIHLRRRGKGGGGGGHLQVRSEDISAQQIKHVQWLHSEPCCCYYNQPQNNPEGLTEQFNAPLVPVTAATFTVN